MDYAQCKQSVNRGSTVDIRLKFGLGVARYTLSLWEVTASGYQRAADIEKNGSSEDARKDDFEIPVNWQGKRLIYFPATMTYPGDSGEVSSAIEVFANGKSIGSSTIPARITSGGYVSIKNGLILEAT
jgi:hypothetical protein